jgi:dihydroflavonol-4-reductase
MDERILITGATGFLGREVCRRLVARGARVRALLRPGATPESAGDAAIEWFRGDLRDTLSLTGAARDIDLVIHLAAVHRGGSLRRTDFWQVNAEGTKRLLQEASRSGVRRFVYVSTAGVLGDVGPDHLGTESDSPHPCDLYELTKWRAEQAVRRIAHTDGLEAVIVRPSAVYGPGETRFQKLFRPLHRRRFVLIGSGHHRLHFIHVRDAAEGILAAAAAPKAVGETYLLADAAPIRMADLVRLIADILAVPAPRHRIPYAPVYALALMCEGLCRPLGLSPPIYRRRLRFFGADRAYSTDKIRTSLGFEARIGLADGFRELADWYREKGLL